MRLPNYRVGWFIPNQIAALTHFHSDVTAEDFLGVVETGQQLLASVSNAFHIIVDNRKVAPSAPVSLAQMRQMVPYLNHPLLGWVVVIKPEQSTLDTSSLPVEQAGDTRLKNVSSLQEALSYLQQTAPDLDWHQADMAFFPS